MVINSDRFKNFLVIEIFSVGLTKRLTLKELIKIDTIDMMDMIDFSILKYLLYKQYFQTQILLPCF